MKITPDVFEAYLKCPTKCWLRATNEPSAGGSYLEWVTVQNDSYQVSERRRLAAESPDDEVVISPDMKDLKDAKWRLAFSLAARARTNSYVLESELHALERVPAEGRGRPAQFIPIRFVFTNKLGKRGQAGTGLRCFCAFEISGTRNRPRQNYSRRRSRHVESEDLCPNQRSAEGDRENRFVAVQPLTSRSRF
jgi:hypothetical protein